MSIRKGDSWGTPGALPAGAPTVATDAHLRRVVAAAAGTPITVGLTGGSLWRALGGESVVGRIGSGDAMHLPVDVVEVRGLNRPEYFVNALVARRRGWLGWRTACVAMNGQYLDGRRIGNRAHPGDGLIDVYEALLPLGDLVKVARRARNGAHLPHPGISERRVPATVVSFASPRRIWLDGESVGRALAVDLAVRGGRLTVVL